MFFFLNYFYKKKMKLYKSKKIFKNWAQKQIIWLMKIWEYKNHFLNFEKIEINCNEIITFLYAIFLTFITYLNLIMNIRTQSFWKRIMYSIFSIRNISVTLMWMIFASRNIWPFWSKNKEYFECLKNYFWKVFKLS